MEKLINGINNIIDEIHSNERTIRTLSKENKHKEIQVIMSIKEDKDKIIDIISNNKEFLNLFYPESNLDDIVEKLQNNKIENYTEATILIDLLNSVKEHNTMKKSVSTENEKSCEVSNKKKGTLDRFTDFMKS